MSRTYGVGLAVSAIARAWPPTRATRPSVHSRGSESADAHHSHGGVGEPRLVGLSEAFGERGRGRPLTMPVGEPAHQRTAGD
ncbi:hypothetical protein ACFWWC_08165 [Streptomyces sp. NPDC058642]|uniref:hypothetical protein n=1 Tax=Streptomyces sp. NPDC058642 TaxID=3346572 RepID=UPI00364E5750